MRTLLIAAIIVVLLAILVIASPFVDVRQNEAGSLPTIEADEGGVSAIPGEAPSFDVETGSVKVGDDSIAIETAEGANAPSDSPAGEAGGEERTAP